MTVKGLKIDYILMWYMTVKGLNIDYILIWCMTVKGLKIDYILVWYMTVKGLNIDYILVWYMTVKGLKIDYILMWYMTVKGLNIYYIHVICLFSMICLHDLFYLCIQERLSMINQEVRNLSISKISCSCFPIWRVLTFMLPFLNCKTHYSHLTIFTNWTCAVFSLFWLSVCPSIHLSEAFHFVLVTVTAILHVRSLLPISLVSISCIKVKQCYYTMRKCNTENIVVIAVLPTGKCEPSVYSISADVLY